MIALFLGLLSASVSAATLDVSITGLSQANSAILVVDAGKGVREVLCRDDATSPDKASDGLWTCDPLVTDGSEVWVVLATDAGVFRVGSIPVSGPRVRVGLEKTGSGVRVISNPSFTPPFPGSVPAGPGMVLITRLQSANVDGAPMMLVEAGASVAEHPCRDDGALFDVKLNDGIFLCTGFLPGIAGADEFPVTISLRTPDGESLQLATLMMEGGAGIRYATIDGSDPDEASADPFDLQVLPKRAKKQDPRSSKAAAGDDHQVRGPPTAPPNGGPPIAPPMGGASRLPSGSGIWPFLSLALAAGLGFVLVSRRRNHPVPAMLEPVGAPRLGRVGPRPEGAAISLLVSDRGQALNALVAHLSGHRRVVVLGFDGLPTDLQVSHPVYTIRSTAMVDALESVQGLVRAAGAPVAVIIVDPAQLTSDALISPIALQEFYESLDAITWSVLIVGASEEPRKGRPVWRLQDDGSWSVIKVS